MDNLFEADISDYSQPNEQTPWQKRFESVIKFFWLRPCPKVSAGVWSIGSYGLKWNRTLCWLRGHKWLYVRSSQPASSSVIEQRRGRMCTCCDAFEDLGQWLVEPPFSEPVQFGVFAEGEQ